MPTQYPVSKDPMDLIPELQERWERLRAIFTVEFPGYDLRLTCTHRPPEIQLELFMKGRRHLPDGRFVVIDRDAVLTNKDGFRNLSLHNHYKARAFDVAIVNTLRNRAIWVTNENPVPEQWRRLVALGKEVGLFNGGVWSNPSDWPHFELA